MKEEILNVGKTLKELYFNQAALVEEIATYSRLVTSRELELTPDGGWDGKNQEQRDVLKNKIFVADERLQNYVVSLQSFLDEAENTKNQILGYEALRRSYEWVVKLMEAENAKD